MRPNRLAACERLVDQWKEHLIRLRNPGCKLPEWPRGHRAGKALQMKTCIEELEEALSGEGRE